MAYFNNLILLPIFHFVLSLIRFNQFDLFESLVPFFGFKQGAIVKKNF